MSEIEAQRLSEIIVVRKGEPDDAEITWRMFQAHLNWINVWYEMNQVVQRRDSGSLGIQRELLSGYPSAIAEADGRIIGFCVSEFREIGILEVRNIYVDDPYRKHGIGSMMLREIEEQSKVSEVSCLVAFASEKYYKDKQCPTGLFERAGFQTQALFPHTEMYLKTLRSSRKSFSSFATSPIINDVIRVIPDPLS